MHFKTEFEREVRRTVREFGMIRAHERVAVALSGGKDSVVLLHQLAALRERLPMELHAILIDEGIAGYRSHTIRVARRECRKAGVPLTIVSFKREVGQSLDAILRTQRREGACTYCGVFRRRLLERAARKLKADKLALGHNLDDAAQTLLLNLYRNEPGRIARFWPVSAQEGRASGAEADEEARMVPRIRPLIRIPEREVALYAQLQGYGIHYQSCPYATEAMRQSVRTQLNEMEERYAGTKRRLYNAWMELGASAGEGPEREKRAGAESGHSEQRVRGARPSRGAARPLAPCRICGEMASEPTCAACRLMTGWKKNVGTSGARRKQG